MSRLLITLGLVFLLLGFFWPWLVKLPFGRLPGDFRFERGGFGVYFPLATGLIVSIVISLLLWMFRR